MTSKGVVISISPSLSFHVRLRMVSQPCVIVLIQATLFSHLLLSFPSPPTPPHPPALFLRRWFVRQWLPRSLSSPQFSFLSLPLSFRDGPHILQPTHSTLTPALCCCYSATLLKHDFRRQTKRASVVYNEARSFVSSPLFQASSPSSVFFWISTLPCPSRSLNMDKFKAALLLSELCIPRRQERSALTERRTREILVKLGKGWITFYFGFSTREFLLLASRI